MTSRRYLLAGLAVGLLVGAWFMLGTGRSRVGPQAQLNPHSIVVRELPRNGGEVYERFDFDPTMTPWDFGGRRAYACAFEEYIVAGVVQFTVTAELVGDPPYPFPIEVNDTDYSGGQPDETQPCGLGTFPRSGGPGSKQVFDGTPLDPVTPLVPVYLDGVLLAEVFGADGPILGDENDETIYSPGDELGEFWMWYEESEAGNPPVPIARLTVTPMALGVTFGTTC